MKKDENGIDDANVVSETTELFNPLETPEFMALRKWCEEHKVGFTIVAYCKPCQDKVSDDLFMNQFVSANQGATKSLHVTASKQAELNMQEHYGETAEITFTKLMMVHALKQEGVSDDVVNTVLNVGASFGNASKPRN